MINLVLSNTQPTNLNGNFVCHIKLYEVKRVLVITVQLLQTGSAFRVAAGCNHSATHEPFSVFVVMVAASGETVYVELPAVRHAAASLLAVSLEKLLDELKA